MRAREFYNIILEAKDPEPNRMTHSVLLNSGKPSKTGAYMKIIIAAIKRGEYFNWSIKNEDFQNKGDVANIKAKIRGGRRVIDELNRSMPDYEGDDKITKPGDILVSLESTEGDEEGEQETFNYTNIKLSHMLKDEVSTGGIKWSLGNIAEAVMGCAMTAKFINPGKKLEPGEVWKVANETVANGTYVSKTNTKISDPISLSIKIAPNDWKIYTEYVKASKDEWVVKNTKLPPGSELGKLNLNSEKYRDLNLLFINGAIYANRSPKVREALAIVNDHESKSIVVKSDGGEAENQSITKVDLNVYYDGDEIEQLNLISLKQGTVGQFGQISGSSFETLNEFWNKSLGIDTPATQKTAWGFQDAYSEEAIQDPATGQTKTKRTLLKDPKTGKSVDPVEIRNHNYKNGPFKNFYAHIGGKLNNYLQSNSVASEYNFIEALYRGIKYHATSDEEGVYMVVISPSLTKDYYELEFGQKLRDALDNVTLTVNNRTEGVKNHILEVIGQARDDNGQPTGKPKLLVQYRSLYQATAIRNIIEMGPFLKEIASIQKAEELPDEIPEVPAGTEPPA